MKHFFTSLFTLLLLLSLKPSTALRAQVLDPSFQPTTLRNAYVGGLQTGVQRIVVQPDGKTLVAGGFDFANGTLVSKIMRLNADGMLDTSFNPGGSGANGFIGAIALQPDGKIIIMGGFTAYNGVPALVQARLNPNGTLDTSFASLPLANLMQIGAVVIQADGKILVGGGLVTSGSENILYRLNYDGTLDTTFTLTPAIASIGAFVRAILVQADGKIILGGYYVNKNSTNSVVRLNADGSVDTSFNAGLINTVSSMALQTDGKLLLAGTQLSGPNAPGVIRLLPDGTRDATFTPGSVTSTTGTSSVVNSLLLLRNGTIVVGGNFTQYNGVACGRIVRLLPDGTLDASFTTGTGANSGVLSLAELAGGQLLAGGSLTQYNGNAKTGLARLSAGGADDTSFNPPVLEGRGSINSVAPLASGKFLVQGSFATFNGTALTGSVASVRRLNADGTLDQSYSTVYGSPYAVQPDGSFYIVYYASPSTST